MFALTFVNYSVLHCTRAIWSAATKDFQTLYGFTTDEIAAMNMCFLLSYAIGGIFLGQLADKYPKRKLIFVIYSCVALVVFTLGAIHSNAEKQRKLIPLYYAIKVINGALQSPGWAINLVVLSHWFPRTGRGLLIGCWACNATFGDLVGTQIYKYVAADGENYYKVFYIVSAMVMSVGLINLFFLVEYPS